MRLEINQYIQNKELKLDKILFVIGGILFIFVALNICNFFFPINELLLIILDLVILALAIFFLIASRLMKKEKKIFLTTLESQEKKDISPIQRGRIIGMNTTKSKDDK